ATSELHGGGLQGRPQGDRMKTRLIAYGVPACGAISTSTPRERADSTSARSSVRAMRCTSEGRLFTFVTRSWRTGSNAAPLQFIPPTLPGMINEPRSEGGV